MSMNIRSIYYNWYQDENPEKFNEDMINYKSKEDITYFIDAVCKGLEIIPNIKYMGSEIEPIRNVYKNTKTAKEIEIESSVLQKIKMNFHIGRDDEEKDITTEIFFPVLIDNQFFIINSNRYTPIYQLVDSGTYRTKKFLILKTLIMPINIEDKSQIIEDINGEKFKSKILNLYLFKARVNLFTYYFAKMGFEETMKFFKFDNKIEIVNIADGEEFNEEMLNFQVSNSIGFNVDPEYFNSDKNHQILVTTLLDNFGSRLKMDKIENQEYWVKKLGMNFTRNNSAHQEKGESILVSFERLLDVITKQILRIPNEDKEDVYCIVRWMAENFINLSKLDNMDLDNKRLRLYEYLVYPLLMKFSKGTYRLLNKKNPSLKEIESIFNIPAGYLISSLVKNETIRYVNTVNSYDLFSVALKGTQGGPQSQFSGKSENVKCRNLHPSYMEKIDLVSTSAGDPGVSFVLTPFVQMEENLYFSKAFNFDGDEDSEYEDE